VDVRRPDPDPNPAEGPVLRWPRPAPVSATGMLTQQKDLATTSMILGLVSLVAGWTVVCPLAGFVVGIVSWRREPGGHDRAVVGLLVDGVVLAAVVGAVAIIAWVWTAV
jgi:uncharacterized membrane protein